MLISFNVINNSNSLISIIMDFLFRLIEPLLKVIRKVIPNFGAIDISPVILIIVIEAFQYIMTKYGINMENKIIDGKIASSDIRKRIKEFGEVLKKKTGKTPGLAVVLVGENPASRVYVKNKIEKTKEVGFNSIEHKLDQNVEEKKLLEVVDQLNNDSNVQGILVQLPLPDHIDADKVLDRILPEKDVDGFHANNVGKLWSGLNSLVPCTPLGCSILVKKNFKDLSGKHGNNWEIKYCWKTNGSAFIRDECNSYNLSLQD